MTRIALDTELLTAIRSVIGGQKYIYPPLAAKLLSKTRHEGEGASGSELSERKKQVLKALALGYTNNEIAVDLYISVKTVETHHRRIYVKLGFSKRSELVRYAHKMGIVRLEDLSGCLHALIGLSCLNRQSNARPNNRIISHPNKAHHIYMSRNGT